MQKALIAGLAIAFICGLLGPFLVLRRLSLLGDGLAHLAFGGVALGLLIGWYPLLIALLFVAVGSLIVQRLIKKNVYGDAAIALILSFGVGLGIIIVGAVRGFNIDLFSYLIGSILAVSTADLVIIFSLLLCTSLFVLFFYKDMVFVTLNQELAWLRKKKMTIVNTLFTLLIAMAVVVSVRAVGILLVSALLVIPTLVALQISSSFKQTMLFSTVASLLGVEAGIILSYYFNLPPSGMIVMLLFSFFGICFAVKKSL
jgi:zinc transport system permease protein